MILYWKNPICTTKNVRRIFIGSCSCGRNRFFFHKAELKKKNNRMVYSEIPKFRMISQIVKN